ncbi:hypothetical protein [Clostridium sp. AWRP]|uniref:hypothetical protein n=1 Tax=Clostridium sp. AWRP TaxID=2212991 RepID=UPI000FD94009|nr:hypothetical protein [Clostridium sp. AWRP]AZV56031.1 hypothetical protein DMR38_05125 [Clostridium sp. AWRP]
MNEVKKGISNKRYEENFFIFMELFQYELFKISHSCKGTFEQKGIYPAEVFESKGGAHLIKKKEADKIINLACDKFYLDNESSELVKNFVYSGLGNDEDPNVEFFDLPYNGYTNAVIKYTSKNNKIFISSIKFNLFWKYNSIEEKYSYKFDNISNFEKKCEELTGLTSNNLKFEQIE